MIIAQLAADSFLLVFLVVVVVLGAMILFVAALIGLSDWSTDRLIQIQKRRRLYTGGAFPVLPPKNKP
jgi:hypothetical protein